MSKSKKKSSVRNYLTQKKVFSMKNKNWAKQIKIIVSDLVMSNFCGYYRVSKINSLFSSAKEVNEH